MDIGVAVNPEFLREGTSVQDFFDPPKTVIGELDPASGDAVTALYDGLPGEVFRVPIPTAEAIKYADNAFHGLKIGFANELGAVCQALGVDSHQVMDVFLADRKLNISPAYLRPGFAFGGSCLPKDLRSLVHAAQRADVSVPILAHVLPSNSDHLQRAVELVERTGKRRVGLFGLSFKPGTDDLRESPLVELAERLFGKGYDLRIYDANVSLSRLLGANREYIETRLPHRAAARGFRRRGARARRGAPGRDQGSGRAVVAAPRRRRPGDCRPHPPSRCRSAPGRTGVRGPCLVIRPVATGRTGAR